jgi:hypothetical protein
MALDIASITNALVSHAKGTGLFVSVNGHEPKNAPGRGLIVAIWAQNIAPYPSGGGLDSTTTLLVFNVRIYLNMIQEPQDMIDQDILRATDELMRIYSGDFTLGDTVREIDLLGESGTALTAEAGYIEQDSAVFRVMTITVPIIVSDLWTQSS